MNVKGSVCEWVEEEEKKGCKRSVSDVVSDNRPWPSLQHPLYIKKGKKKHTATTPATSVDTVVSNCSCTIFDHFAAFFVGSS